jgi:hypothetical protein
MNESYPVSLRGQLVQYLSARPHQHFGNTMFFGPEKPDEILQVRERTAATQVMGIYA